MHNQQTQILDVFPEKKIYILLYRMFSVQSFVPPKNYINPTLLKQNQIKQPQFPFLHFIFFVKYDIVIEDWMIANKYNIRICESSHDVRLHYRKKFGKGIKQPSMDTIESYPSNEEPKNK